MMLLKNLFVLEQMVYSFLGGEKWCHYLTHAKACPFCHQGALYGAQDKSYCPNIDFLSFLSLVSKIVTFLTSMFNYFAHSPK